MSQPANTEINLSLTVAQLEELHELSELSPELLARIHHVLNTKVYIPDQVLRFNHLMELAVANSSDTLNSIYNVCFNFKEVADSFAEFITNLGEHTDAEYLTGMVFSGKYREFFAALHTITNSELEYFAHDACALFEFLHRRSPEETKALTDGLYFASSGNIYGQLNDVICKLYDRFQHLGMCAEWFHLHWDAKRNTELNDIRPTERELEQAQWWRNVHDAGHHHISELRCPICELQKEEAEQQAEREAEAAIERMATMNYGKQGDHK